MTNSRNVLSREQKVQTVNQLVHERQCEGLALQRADSSDRAEWLIDGSSLKNFRLV